MSDVLDVAQVMAESAVFNMKSTITQLLGMLQKHPAAVVAQMADIEQTYAMLIELRIRVAVAENNMAAAQCL